MIGAWNARPPRPKPTTPTSIIRTVLAHKNSFTPAHLKRHCADGPAPAKCHDALRNANSPGQRKISPESDFPPSVWRLCRQRNRDHLHRAHDSRPQGEMAAQRQPGWPFFTCAIFRIAYGSLPLKRAHLREGIQACHHLRSRHVGNWIRVAQRTDVCASPCGERHLWTGLWPRHSGNKSVGGRVVRRTPCYRVECHESRLGSRGDFLFAARDVDGAHSERSPAPLCRRSNLRLAVTRTLANAF